MGADKLLPEKPSGYHGECRSKLSMAGDATGFGLSALTPPGVGAIRPLVNGVVTAVKDIKNGHVGDAVGTLIGTVPSVAGGFVGGGAGADVTRALANEGAIALGANRGNLPDSSAQNLAQDATCHMPPQTSDYAVPAPRVGIHGTKQLPTVGGWKTTVTFNP